MRTLTMLLLLAAILMVGCRAGRPSYSLFKSDSERTTDRLWRQGYGYNNPNSDRARRGQERVNFNGKTSGEDLADRAIGNVVAFVLYEGISAAWRGLTQRRFRTDRQ